MTHQSIRHSAEHGQSLMEFAFGLVLLLLLVSGIVDASRAISTYLSMRDAAQEGALYGSINPSATSEIANRTRTASNNLSGMGSNISIIVTPTVPGLLCAGATNGVTHGIKVRIVYANFPLTMPLIGAFIGNHQTISISAEVIDSIVIPKCG